MPRWRRWALGCGLGVVAFGAALVGGVLWLESRPDVVADLVERALGWPEHAVELGAIDLQWPDRWAIEDLQLQPPEAHAPRVTIEAASAHLPSPWALWNDQQLALGDVALDGLEILRPDQQAARPLELPPAKPPLSLAARTLSLRDGRFAAPADGILSAVDADGVAVDAVDVRWVPRIRQLFAVGSASIERLQLGAIPLHTVEAPQLVLDGTELQLPGAYVGYGTSTVSVSGDITQMDTSPAVDLEVILDDERVETAVSTALGGKSPLRGFLQARVRLRSGGDLPRGGARFEGYLRLRRAEVFVGNDLKMLPKVLIDIAPWFRRQNSGWLEAGDLIGEGAFGRGWVRVQMERPSRRHRTLQAWGHLDGRQMDLIVRAVPKKRDKPGIGVSVKGPVTGPRLKLAKKQQLRSAPPLISSRQ